MNVTVVAAGAACIAAGVYVRRSPEGLWSWFAAEGTNLWGGDDAEETMARGAPTVGNLLILVGLVAVAAGLLGV